MTEFPSLGSHCSLSSCKQLDFLPFACSACKEIFCLEHRTPASHKCPKSAELSHTVSHYICPLCSQLITVDNSQDVNQLVDKHIQAGCPQEATADPRFKCALGKCKEREYQRFVCKGCRKNFCVHHRDPNDHQCERLEWEKKQKAIMLENEAKKSNNNNTNSARYSFQQLMRKSAEKFKSEKNRQTHEKVTLMKMKSSAKGDSKIPEDERFYLEIVYPFESKIKPKLLFFKKSWLVGKVLDIAADAGNVENQNNVQNALKIHLISLKTGIPIPNDLTLADCHEILKSGDSLLLEKETVLRDD